MFIPPFCPNPNCSYHEQQTYDDTWYSHNGFYSTLSYGEVPRFKCRHCRKGFSMKTFHLDYYVKVRCNYPLIFSYLVSSAGTRDIARALSVSTEVIQNRTARLGRQCMAVHTKLMSSATVEEDFAADGFESFCYSQYFPNNIHLLIGCESLCAYYANGVTIRRKGRMRPEQKKKREEIEKRWKPDPGGICKSFKDLLGEMKGYFDRMKRESITLYTDEKYEYRKAICDREEFRSMREAGVLIHDRTSSRRARTVDNPLFPVNYIDREIRKGVANHHRETVQWAKDMSEMMNRLLIYLVYHNLKMPNRVRKEDSDRRVHAEVAGVSKESIDGEWRDVFKARRFLSHHSIPEFWREIWFGLLRTPLDLRGGYRPKYLAV